MSAVRTNDFGVFVSSVADCGPLGIVPTQDAKTTNFEATNSLELPGTLQYGPCDTVNELKNHGAIKDHLENTRAFISPGSAS